MTEYIYPSSQADTLLNHNKIEPSDDGIDAEVQEIINNIEDALANSKIELTYKYKSITPRMITLYADLNGTNISKLKKLLPEISLYVGGNVTIEERTQYRRLIALCVPRTNQQPALFGDFKADWTHYNDSALAFPLGYGSNGAELCDLEKINHVLISGASGSGKSVCLNTIITQILMRTDMQTVKFVMIDPKKVELKIYDGIPQLMRPVATDIPSAVDALDDVCSIMEHRNSVMDEHNVRNNRELEAKTGNCFPRLVVVIDELAELMLQAKKYVEDYIVRIAQLGRSADIHLVIATQEPRAAVVTGLIAANIPSRITFKVATSRQSVIALGRGGAEKLEGKGDMLYMPEDAAGTPRRLQGVYISTEEIERIVNFIKAQLPDNKPQKHKAAGFFGKLRTLIA